MGPKGDSQVKRFKQVHEIEGYAMGYIVNRFEQILCGGCGARDPQVNNFK